MTRLVVPGAVSFRDLVSGSLAELASPAANRPALARNIRPVSLAMPAATIPASHPRAWNDTTDATLFLCGPASYAYASRGGIITPVATPATILASSSVCTSSAK